ncbi:hypothetical protein Droror1_Dr00000196 [Drosera rotundifolia]
MPRPAMYRSKSNGANPLCKKHPKHHQSPGVCSLCLTEKLTKVSKSKNSWIFVRRCAFVAQASSCPSSSSLSSSSSSDISSCASPRGNLPASDHRRHRKGSDHVIFGRSRSMAIDGVGEHWEKKSRFSLRFLRPRKKRDDNHPVLGMRS